MKYKSIVKKIEELLKDEDNKTYPFHTKSELEARNRLRAEMRAELKI